MGASVRRTLSLLQKALLEGTYQLNKYIQSEIGDLTGKKVVHLQCNTGADTIMLAKTAEFAVGVDLVSRRCFVRKKTSRRCGCNQCGLYRG